MSDEELAAAQGQAAEDGVALGAWLGELAARSSTRVEWALGVSRPEVIRQLVGVRLQVSLLERVLAMIDDTGAMELVEAVLRRLDALIDRAVEDRRR